MLLLFFKIAGLEASVVNNNFNAEWSLIKHKETNSDLKVSKFWNEITKTISFL